MSYRRTRRPETCPRCNREAVLLWWEAQLNPKPAVCSECWAKELGKRRAAGWKRSEDYVAELGPVKAEGASA